MIDAAYRLSPHDIAGLVPELVLAGAGVLILMLEAFLPSLRRTAAPLAALATLIAAWLCWAWIPAGASFQGLLTSDGITVAASLVVLLSVFLCVLASRGYLLREGLAAAEYFALLLWCSSGLILLLRATELLTVFVALELLSICLYSLAGYHRRLAVSTEAALKYFLMGAFVSSFVLYGIALVYGETGSTRFDEIAAFFGATTDPPALAVLGLLMLVAGFAFKMSIAPFHAWAPDAYQGAPSPFVAFLSVAPKAASALVLMRLLATVMPGDEASRWPGLVALLAVLSMLVGNVLALVQRDIKRMLAYSGVAHMGYLLVPLVGLDRASYEPVIVYLVAYALMNAGAFAIIGLLYSRPGEQHLISDLAGWGYRYPFLGACLSICMLSLGGIPPTFGFIGKYLIFVHAMHQQRLWLALAIVFTSLIGIYYYLRVVYTLYMRAEVKLPEGLSIDLWGRTAALLAAGGTLALGIWPGHVLRWLETAASLLP